ncbi:MAG: glycosyltransferase family 2 protein [Planctomycetota bacterium]
MTSTRSTDHSTPPESPSRAVRGLLSVVIPCHNEQEVIEATHARLAEVLPRSGMDFEVLYVDDGSRDQTLARLEAIAARDARVQVIELARNFGQQAAMSAGLAAAHGDAIVITDADLQDPPEVILEMVRRWQDGVDVAYGRRRSRDGETRFKLLTASLFHRMFARLVPYPMPVDTGDFKLIDRAVADAVVALPEKRRYLRSLVPWAGFRHEPVWYDRHARLAGQTKYSPWKLLKLAADALILSSDAPVRLTWVATAGLALVGGAAATVATGSWWMSAAGTGREPTIAAITAVACLVGAVQTAAVAVVGEYVVRGYRESQGRPTWVVRRTIGGGRAATRPSAKAA